ncbi:hypothetical protein QTP88_022082 [Uroleucon formosanum]
MSKDFYPNIWCLISILATLPVSTSSAERSFSTLRRLKTYLRNSCSEDCLTGLALLSVEKCLFAGLLSRRYLFLYFFSIVVNKRSNKMYKPETSYEEFLKSEQKKYPELNLNDIEVLKERLKENIDLSPIRNKLIVMFLHSNFFNVDMAYKAIVAYQKYRRELPHIFENYDPSSEDMKQVFDSISISIVLNPTTGKQERILYTDFKSTDPREFDFVHCVRYFFMLLEYLMVTSGTFDGLVLTMNSKGICWRHVTKTPMNTFKKLIGFVQEALPVRLKEVHILNAGTIVSMLFNIIRPFMKSSLMDLMKIHTEDSTEIFDHLPIDIMPQEMGGNGKSHYEHCEETYNQMLSARDYILSL